MGPGEAFVRIYDTTIDEQVRLGDFDAAWAEKQKTALRRNIKKAG